MAKTHLRVVARLVLLFSLVFALSLTQGWADSIGSSATHRGTYDTSTGQVFIYDGAFLPTGDTVTFFNWFGDTFTGSKDLTPLIFTFNPGTDTYTVVGIGTQEQNVTASGSVQSFAFGLLAGGTATATSGTDYTFGFVEGLADSSGNVTGATSGAVGHNSPVDGGFGVSGAGSTNDWVFTPSTFTSGNVGLGTTFGANGTNPLNNPAAGGFNVDRTYSANVTASSSGVAEPGTFSLITGAGLVLAGLFRYRYSRGRS
jgi:hypothetical protein